jgi:DNA-binding response OmpR family regulator
LLVEPDATLRAAIAHLLEESDCTVLVAESPEQALHLCRVKRVDVVLTDVVLPNSSGPDLVRELRQFDAHLRVVFMADGSATNALGVVVPDELGILQKPFTPDQLATRICSLLNSRDGSRGRLGDTG